MTANADMTSTVGEGRHLPECPLATDCKHDYYNEPPVQCADCGEVCICDLLRACEERVWDEAYANGFNAGRAHGELRACSLSHKHGYEQGVQAARQIVVSQCAHTKSPSSGYSCDHDLAVAAIDALKEDK